MRHTTGLFLLLIAIASLAPPGRAQGTFPRDGNEVLALRLHDWYRESQANLARLEADRTKVRGYINEVAPGSTMVGTAVAPEDVARLKQIEEDIARERTRIRDLEASWDKNRADPSAPARSFAGRYGPLSGTGQSSTDSRYDRIEFAIRNFPFNVPPPPATAAPATAPQTPAVQPAAANSLTLELPGYWGHLSYTISGAQLDRPTGSDRGNVGGRQYTGKLTGNTLRVSGTAISDNPSSGPGSADYYEIVVSVTVGKEHSEYGYIAPKGEKLNKPFSLSVPVDRGATSGSFSIRLIEQNANYGPHGWAVSGSLTRDPATQPGPEPAAPAAPKPPPRPSTPPIAGPPNLEGAIGQITEHINRFKDTCFGSVAFLGEANKFRTYFNPQDIVIEDATPNAISVLGTRGAGGALADMTDGYGAPLPNVMYLPFKVPIAPGDKPTRSEQRQTVWHEGVHQIEALHGDRSTSDYKQHEPYRERNAAYLDAIVIELSNLELIEKHARVKPESESPEEWRAWKANDARNEIRAIADRFAALEKGAATKEVFRGRFKPGERQEWPPDLRELQVWAGIKVRFSDILDAYASGGSDRCKGLGDLDIRAPSAPGRLPRVSR